MSDLSIAAENMRRQSYDMGRYEIGRHFSAGLKAVLGDAQACDVLDKIIEWSKTHPEPDMDVVLGLKQGTTNRY